MAGWCSEVFKEEFTVAKFSLDYKNPKSFTRFQVALIFVNVILGLVGCSYKWGWPKVYLAWRALGALFTVCLLVTSIDLNGYYDNGPENRRKWLIYLTNWDLVILMSYALTDLTTSVYVHVKHQEIVKGLSREMPWYLKMTWVLYNISMPLALLVSSLYWSLLFKHGQSLAGYRILPFLSHGTNSIYAFINVLVTDIPSRILHFAHIVVVGVSYIVFTIIYSAAGGTNDDEKHYIYMQLNWSNSRRTTLLALGVLFVAILFHMLVFGMSLLRQKVYTACRKKNTSVITDSPKIYRKMRDQHSIQGECHC